MTQDEASGDRVRRSVRLDPSGWQMMCRIADAYWEGKRHPAGDAAVIDAILGTATAFPQEPSAAFNVTFADFAAAVAKRLGQPGKKFYFGNDVAAALIKAIDSYPTPQTVVPGTPGFARKLPSGSPPVPTGPWTIAVPLHLADQLPEADLRSFVENALLAKAERLGLAGIPLKLLPPPRALPPQHTVLTSRHLDEALVAILAALPLTSPIEDPRVPLALQWLRSALGFRAA